MGDEVMKSVSLIIQCSMVLPLFTESAVAYPVPTKHQCVVYLIPIST